MIKIFKSNKKGLLRPYYHSRKKIKIILKRVWLTREIQEISKKKSNKNVIRKKNLKNPFSIEFI